MPEEDGTHLKEEMDAALAAPVFRRSPVLSRLLRFLVDAAIRGEGRALKSYAVAVDGLGKPADFDAQADSYSRVQVVRLRRALETFYAREGKARPFRLVIESGGYEARLESRDDGRTVPAGESVTASGLEASRPGLAPALRGKRWALAAAALLLFLLGVVLAQSWTARMEAERRWSQSDFPFVAIRVAPAEGAGDPDPHLAAEAVRLRRALLAQAARYEGTRVSREVGRPGHYAIDIALTPVSAGTRADILVVQQKDQRVIWSAQQLLPVATAAGSALPDGPLRPQIYRILQPTGVIHGFERRWRTDAGSPYRCWLRFSLLLREAPFRDDPQLEDCAQQWYRQAPRHPLAAAVQGWVLTSKANGAFSDNGRRQMLDQAMALLDSARAINPDSPHLQVSAMRAHAMAGHRDKVVQAAEAVLEWNPDSPDLRGAAATFLVLQNVGKGEALLDSAIAGHDDPPGWFFIARYAQALMRDDPRAAGQALVEMKARGTDGLGPQLLEAALAAREGRLAEARGHRRQIEQELPVVRMRPEALLQRLPVAPEVRERLRQWLVPAFPELAPPPRRAGR